MALQTWADAAGCGSDDHFGAGVGFQPGADVIDGSALFQPPFNNLEPADIGLPATERFAMALASMEVIL